MHVTSFHSIQCTPPRKSCNYFDKFSLFRQCTLTSIIVFTFTFVGPRPALAGTYKVTYSGGKIVLTENGHSTTIMYSPSGISYGAGGTCDCNTPDTSGSIIGSGQITATFTFVPDPSIPNDAPPPAVVVLENCQAQAQFYGGNSADVTGVSADDGLGFPDVLGYLGTDVDSASSGTPSGPIGLYKIVQNPGYSFTETCSPSLNGSLSQATGVTQSGGDMMGGGVTYQATATPLMVNLGGGIGSQSNHQYLIGQTMDDSLLTGGLTSSNFNWTITGSCNPFVTWKLSNYVDNITPIIQANEPSSGSVIMLNGDIQAETASSLNCYPKTQSNGDVTECTVDLAVPNGAYPVGGFPGTTIKSFPFSVLNPNLLQALQIQPGSVMIDQGEIMGLLTYQTSTFMLMNVATPSSFTNNGQNFGQYAMIQEITPTRSYVDVTGNFHTLFNNGQMGLDNKWTYISALADGNNPINGTKTNNHFNFTAYDGPVITVPQNAQSMNALDSFHDWLMYQPPNGTWVPLYDGTWQWSGTANNSNNLWQLTQSSCTSNAGGKNPAFPEWNMLWTNDPGLSTYN